MKILIAIDSFKGSISSRAAAVKISERLIFAEPSIKITNIPLGRFRDHRRGKNG